MDISAIQRNDSTITLDLNGLTHILSMTDAERLFVQLQYILGVNGVTQFPWFSTPLPNVIINNSDLNLDLDSDLKVT